MFSEPVQCRTQQRENTHRRIIDVADQLFRTQGFRATSIRQIAGEASVSTGTVMSVGDKSALLAAVFEASIAQMQREQASQPDTPQIPDAASTPERITARLRPFLELFARDQELSREYAAVLVRGTHDTGIFAQMADELTAAIASDFETSGMTAERASAASRTVYFAYLGVLFAWAGGDSNVHSALNELTRVISLITDRNVED